MRKRILIIASVLLFGAGIATLPGTSEASQGAFPEATPGEDAITVNETYDGQSVTVTGDQVLIVNLEGNPTTGYSWGVVAVDDTVLRQIGETEFEPYLPGRIGSAGRQMLHFRATGEGEITLSLAYRRSWETASPLKYFSIHVQTKGPFSPIIEEMQAEPAPTPEDLGPIAVDAVPSSFNWCDQGGCTPAKDQGACGSCWAFATSGVVESLIQIEDSITRDLSEQYLVSCNDYGWGCAGGSRAFDFLIDRIPPGESAAGAVYEADFPYTSGGTGVNGPCTGQPHAHHEELTSWGMVYAAHPSVATIKQLIHNHGPVYVSVCASGPVFNSYGGGIYQTDESEACGGGTNHAVVLVGWDDSQGTSGIWYLKNSWGTSWGESGYMRIGYGISNVGGYPAYAVYHEPPSLSIDDASVTEGDSGSVNATFTVTLSAASAWPITVEYTTTDGSATAPADYTSIPTTTLTFDPGETEQFITVTVESDAMNEYDETFFVSLANSENATIGDPQAQGTIEDDDDPPCLSIDDRSITEGDSGSVSAVLTVTLSVASGKPITVEYATVDGSATAPADYTSIPTTTLTFDPGETEQFITVTVQGDTTDEYGETFFVSLANPENATIGDPQAQGTIEDDDDPPNLSIADTSVTEGDGGSVNATFTVTLSAASGKPITVAYATADGSATAPADYTSIPTTTLTFDPGETEQWIAVSVQGDTLDELAHETFFVNLDNEENATLSDAQAQGTIEDDDEPPVVDFSSPDYSVDEDTGPATITVTLDAVSGLTVTVVYSTANGTATAGEDYTAVSRTLTFTPGVTSQSFEVGIIDDEVNESEETIILTLSSPDQATIRLH